MTNESTTEEGPDEGLTASTTKENTQDEPVATTGRYIPKVHSLVPDPVAVPKSILDISTNVFLKTSIEANKVRPQHRKELTNPKKIRKLLRHVMKTNQTSNEHGK